MTSSHHLLQILAGGFCALVAAGIVALIVAAMDAKTSHLEGS